MPASNLKPKEDLTIRQTKIKKRDMSPLGKRLFEISQEAIALDEPAYNEKAIERELKERRGGHFPDDENSHIS